MKRNRFWVCWGIVLLGLAMGVSADPPAELDYQGKILVNDIPLTGDGYFKYAISDAAATTNYWSQDGTSTGEPTGFVTNECYNGVFSVALGASPMTAIDPDIFAAGVDLVLRVWFSDDGVTFNEMLPSQELLSSPYAINSDQVDGYDAAELISAATNTFVETDPVFVASDAYGISSGDIVDWDTAYGWGDHATNGYLTGETDPVWTAASTGYYQKTVADGLFVDEAGDTMTGTLTIDAGASAVLDISSSGDTVQIGNGATANTNGVAVGTGPDGRNQGVAVGYRANAYNSGVAVGHSASGGTWGVAVGYQSEGHAQGVAVGRDSTGYSFGAALGPYASGQWYGVAVGRAARGVTNGIALGYNAEGSMTNIAIGVDADAQEGLERIALGHEVTNTVDNSARLRGAIYMDGGLALYGRTPFATGAFKQLVPLPPLDNVVYVATNGSPGGPGAIDRPYDTPQNAYNAAAFRYAGVPATVVIAAGLYPGLNMTAGNIHVLGESRAQLDSLMVSAAANSIRGKQRVENLIVAGVATVAVDSGQDVKFHNCRFGTGLFIYGPNVEVQDCFAAGMDGAAVIVGNGASPIRQVAIYNSSLVNKDSGNAALLVNVGVETLEVIGNKIANYDPDPIGGIRAWAAIEDQEISLNPNLPPHLYSHNVIRGAETALGTVPAVYDPGVGAGATTITFVHNAVWGDVGVNSNLQFYANNVVYGQINNTGGLIGWGQAGVGTGTDPAGNTEHQAVYPQFGAFTPGEGFPNAWLD